MLEASNVTSFNFNFVFIFKFLMDIALMVSFKPFILCNRLPLRCSVVLSSS